MYKLSEQENKVDKFTVIHTYTICAVCLVFFFHHIECFVSKSVHSDFIILPSLLQPLTSFCQLPPSLALFIHPFPLYTLYRMDRVDTRCIPPSVSVLVASLGCGVSNQAVRGCLSVTSTLSLGGDTESSVEKKGRPHLLRNGLSNGDLQSCGKKKQAHPIETVYYFNRKHLILFETVPLQVFHQCITNPAACSV